MEKRKQTRAFLAEGICMARGTGGELPKEGVNVTNLGADGCCLELPARQTGTFLPEHQKLSLELIQPWLPNHALKGEIQWQREERTRGRTLLRVGVKFLETADGYLAELDRVVDGIVHSNLRGNAWILAKLQRGQS